MAALLRLLALSLLFTLSCHLYGASNISKDDLDAQKELLQLKIDSTMEVAQKDIETLNKRFDAVDKRIDDQASRVGDIGNAIDRFTAISGIIGVLTTVLLAAGGFVGYFSVVSRVRQEAQEAASRWLLDNEKELRTQTETLHSRAQESIHTTVEGVNNTMTEVSAALERAQQEINRRQTDSPAMSESKRDVETLRQRSEELKKVPENSYSYDDWNTRAFAAYNAGQLERAALYWENAAKTPAAGAVNSANAMFYKGITHSQMSDYEKANATYSQIIDAYSADSTPSIRELVAKAMVNRAVSYGQVGDHEKAISACDQIIDLYGADSNPAMREQVAKALANKATAFSKICDYEKANASYDRIISIYRTDNHPSIQMVLENAWNGRGFNLLLMAKQALAKQNETEATELLQQSKRDLQKALEKKTQWGMALGNLAYTQWLLKTPAEAETLFRTALNSQEDGGEYLYKATQDDIALHPILEDTGFREMVERLWAEYKT